MVKKFVLITLFVLFAGVLIYGAVNRTTAKSETAARNDAQNQVTNERHSNGDELSSLVSQEPFSQQNGQGNQGQGNQGQGNQGQGSQGQGSQGQGNQGQGNQDAGSGQMSTNASGNNGEGRGLNQQREETEIQELNMISGVVVQAPAYGIDMILETAEGEVLIGTGPGYLAEQGFVVLIGDSVSVSGFWENDEFKAVEITLLADGNSIILRDERGRPMWSGAGRRAINLQISQNNG
jgi:hypothetical protein